MIKTTSICLEGFRREEINIGGAINADSVAKVLNLVYILLSFPCMITNPIMEYLPGK